ncbi:hypothetical protein EDB80DRAFT_112416 [Ilyonectria destructans]|nr:hypothetical protein EDB80DRAFT_112416 [Ilyonectria destructans]
MRGSIGWMHATVGILLSRVPPGRAEAFFASWFSEPSVCPLPGLRKMRYREENLGLRFWDAASPDRVDQRAPPRIGALPEDRRGGRKAGGGPCVIRPGPWPESTKGSGTGEVRMWTRYAKCKPWKAVSGRNSGSRNGWNLDGTTPARWHMIPQCFRRHHAGWPQVDLDSTAADFNVDLANVSPLWRV